MATKTSKQTSSKSEQAKKLRQAAKAREAVDVAKQQVANFRIMEGTTMMDVADLRPHPVLSKIMPAQDEDAREGMLTSMADRMRAGLPPVIMPLTVMPDGTVIDGMTRLSLASGLKGIKQLPVQFIEAENEAAILEAGVLLNAARRQMTQDVRKKIASDLLTADPEWSNRHVARIAGLSPTTVGTIREQLGEAAKSDTRKSTKGKKQKAGSAKRRGPRANNAKGTKKQVHPAVGALRLLMSNEFDNAALTEAFAGVEWSAAQVDNLRHWADEMATVATTQRERLKQAAKAAAKKSAK